MTDVNKLYLSKTMVQEMLEHARDTLPNECVGLLFGQDDRVKRRVPLTNIADTSTRYAADPTGLFAALQVGEAKGDDLLAIYHSHPNGRQTPSETDLKEARYNVLYLIVAPQLGVLRAFMLNKEVSEVDLVVFS